MSKNYRLKPYDEVENHHFITRENWDKLVECNDLEVHSLRGFLSSTVLVAPRNENPTSLFDYVMIDRADLYDASEKNATAETETTNPAPNEVVNEKTYTKKEIREAATRVMSKSDNPSVTDAVVSALALAKLITELK